MTRIFVGTSGYYYEDWRGLFYPKSLHRKDFLKYYCQYFNALELNTTFYQMPEKDKLIKYTDPDLQPLVLSMKAHRDITHGHAGTQVLREFMTEIKPVIECGILKILLFQFPFSFCYSEKAWDKIIMISREVPRIKPVIEFRHKSWFQEDILLRIRDLGIAVCAIDMPRLGKLPGQQLPITCSPAYMRFHGRNKDKWWDHKEPWERYDYLYTEKDLTKLIPSIREWIEKQTTAYIFFNNHYQGQAIKNAQLMMAFFAD
ncbi:DUF72 domain-containing protein [bacterium]|nr:DUF72 domain-containing protein [bacterium]